MDPAVEAERLRFRHSYRDVLAGVLADGVGSGELPDQDPEATAAALVGAIGEAMVGPLADRSDPEPAIESLVSFCIRAIGKEPAYVNA